LAALYALEKELILILNQRECPRLAYIPDTDAEKTAIAAETCASRRAHGTTAQPPPDKILQKYRDEGQGARLVLSIGSKGPSSAWRNQVSDCRTSETAVSPEATLRLLQQETILVDRNVA